MVHTADVVAVMDTQDLEASLRRDQSADIDVVCRTSSSSR